MVNQRNAWRWLAALASDYAIIAFAMVLAYFGFQLGPVVGGVAIFVAICIIGTRQHALTILGHDGAHTLITRNRYWNDLLTNLFCFWPMGFGLSGYRKFHFAHHRHLGTPRDPEIAYKAEAAYALPAWPSRLAGRYFIAFFGDGIKEETMFIKYLIGMCSLPDRIGPALVWGTVVLCLWYFSAWWIAGLWFAAIFTSFWCVFRIRVWSEHVGTPGVHRIHAPLIYRLIFVPHNTWYHFEHHRFPQVPYWNLHAARALETTVPIFAIETLYLSYTVYPPTPEMRLP